MAQIIKHRRGSLEALSAVTSSLQKGEIVIASGSSNLTVTNGTSLVFAVPENGQVQATNRFLIGDAVPNTFAGSTYNGLVKGVPYYASGSSTLYLLGTDGNEAINLVGNIQPFSASVAASINSLSSSIGSGTIGNSVTLLNAFTASQEAKNSTLATYTSSVDSRLTQLETNSGSLITSASAAAVSISNLNSFTQSFSQSVATDFSASNASITALSASVASVTGDFSSSVATSFSASNAARVDLSQSVSTSFANVSNEQSEQDARLTSLENVTGSYATTGSNTFFGTQVITGSMYITNDLIVQGSSSLQDITASAVSIGTNIVKLNTATPAVRFGGIEVFDSGSSQATGSLLWDSLNNHWLYVHPSGAGEGYNSAILIAGPKNTGAIGEESGLTSGKIPVAVGEDHIDNSIMTQSGGNKITLSGSLDVLNEISASTINGIGNVTAFSQSVDSRVATLETSLGGGGSIGTRVSNLETFTGSQESKNSTLATYTASVDSDLSAIHSFTASQENKNSTLATYTASVDGHIADINSWTSSIATEQTTQNNRLTSLESFSGSQENKDSTLATYTASVDSRLGQLETNSGSQALRLTSLESFSGSQESKNSTLATYTASVDSQLSQLNADSASQAGRLTNIESFTGSQESKNSTLATYTSSVDGRLSSIETFTSSFGTTFSSSVDSRLDTLEGTGTIQGVGTGNNVTFAKVTTTGDVVVGGDLVVQGNTVSLNTSTLVVEDKLITLASGSTDAATANGAGLEVAGANATFTYNSTPNAWTANIPISASAFTGSFNLPTGGSTKRVAFRNSNGNLDLVPTASVAGDLLQWDGSDFVMSNTIDGGSF